MKTTKVNPIHKGGSVLLITKLHTNFTITYFQQRLMYNGLIDFIDKHNILSQTQFGFQKNKSTELAIALLHKSQTHLKKKNHVTVSS